MIFLLGQFGSTYMSKKHLEFDDGKARKFWKISLAGSTHTVNYGRIGSEGRSLTKEFDSTSKARDSFDKLVKQKLDKGYVEVGRSAKSSKKKSSKATNKKSSKKTVSKPKSSKASRSKTKKVSTKKRSSKEPFFKPLRASQKKRYEPLSPDVVKHWEKEYGIKYPSALIKLLKTQNGGEVTWPDFKFGRTTYELLELSAIRKSSSFEPLTVGYPDHLELMKGKLADPQLIVPLFGDGHTFIALEYRENGPKKEPSVIYLDIEGRPSLKKIAGSFKEFLDCQTRPARLPKVRVDLMDPESQIGHVERRKTLVDKITNKPFQLEDRNWLFLFEDRVECFSYAASYRRVSKEKFSNEPHFERWKRYWVKLEHIAEMKIVPWVGTKVLQVSSPMKVRWDFSEREKGKGWKNKSDGPILYFYFHGTPKNMKECIAKINAAKK